MSAPVLTEEQAWAEFDRCAEGAARFVWRSGLALIECKRATPHGRWLQHLSERGVSEDQAKRAMRIVRELSEAEFAAAGSQRAALALIASRNRARAPDMGDIDAAVTAGHLTAAEGADLRGRIASGRVNPERLPRILGEAAARASGRVRHPAKFSPEIVAALTLRLPACVPPPARLLDPFAGVGTVHKLAERGYETVGVEIEPEWAQQHPDTIRGDSRSLPFDADDFDIVVTSPAYGNKMARTSPAHILGGPVYDYATQLGRSPSQGSSALHAFGDAYKALHEAVWGECARVLRAGGEMWLNTRDPLQDGRAVPVTAWHLAALRALGFTERGCYVVTTQGMRGGQNTDRQQGETIWRLTLPAQPQR